MRRRDFGLALLSTVLAPPAARALDRQLVRLVVPYVPGGGNDIYARLYAEPLAAILKCPVVVENKSGASGNIGAEVVVHAAPDGHTLLYGSSSVAINPFILPQMPFDTERDLLPLSLMISQPLVMVVRSDQKARDLAGYLDRARREKVPVNFGSQGAGSSSALILAKLFKQAGIGDVTHVPYRGAGQLLQAIVAGDVQVALMIWPVVKPFVESGQLVAVAVSGAQPIEQLPGIPTLDAAGFPGLIADQWHAFFLPRKTPPAIVKELHEALAATVRLPQIAERLKADGATAVADSPEHFAAFFAEELKRWKVIVDDLGVKVKE
jgi:tripartite-type tricarboxylate transporter receptor subunit TctC